jgi:hypothetical protein
VESGSARQGAEVVATFNGVPRIPDSIALHPGYARFPCCKERNSDFLGNSTAKNGIDGGDVVEDTLKNTIGIPIP